MRLLLLKEVKRDMTIHLFFITVTIERRKPTNEELQHYRYVRQLEEEMIDRKCKVYQRY